MVSPKDRNTPLGVSENINLLSMTPSTRRFQFNLEKTAVDISDFLINNWTDALPKTFLCQWDCTQDTETSNVRVGFCSGGCSNILEAFEDGLELSRVLNGVEVDGVFSPGLRVFFGCLSSSPVINFLLQFWDEFFAKHPTGTYIQYVFGISGSLVQMALDKSPYREQVMVVAVNCTSAPIHSRVLNLRSDGDFFGDPDALWLSRSPDALGTFVLRFSDPTFYPAIQSCYTYDSNSHESSRDKEHPMASVLTQNANWFDPKPVCEPFLMEGVECDDLLVDIIRGTNSGYTSTLEGRELWSEFFLERISCFVASCIRLVDYITLYVKASKSKEKDLTSTSIVTSVTSRNITTNSSLLGTSALTVPTTPISVSSLTNYTTTSNRTDETSFALTSFTSASSNHAPSTEALSTSSLNLTTSAFSVSYQVTSIATNSTLVSVTSSARLSSNSAISSPTALVSLPSTKTWTIGVLSGVWCVFGVSQCVLIYCERRRNPNLRLPAFILNSIVTLVTLIDFVYNLSLWHTAEGLLHTTLSLYSMSCLIRETMYLSFPVVRQGLQRGAIFVTNWRRFSKSKPQATIIRVNNGFRRTMRRARIFLELMFLFSLGISYFVGCLLRPGLVDYVAIDAIHFIFVCSLVATLATFLYQST